LPLAPIGSVPDGLEPADRGFLLFMLTISNQMSMCKYDIKLEYHITILTNGRYFDIIRCQFRRME